MKSLIINDFTVFSDLLISDLYLVIFY